VPGITTTLIRWRRTYRQGRRSRGRGRGDKSPQNLERGDCPPPPPRGGIVPQILSCCKILITRLLALQCRKMCFSLYSRTFIVSPAMRPPRIPVRSTPMPTDAFCNGFIAMSQCLKHCVKVDRELRTLRSGNISGFVSILPLMYIERIVLRAVYNHMSNSARLNH